MARTQIKKRWYSKHPGRWIPSLEDALAASDPRRRNLAWTMLIEVGGERGCQSRFADLVGCRQGQVSAWLSGEREIGLEAIEAITEATGRSKGELLQDSHPLAISYGFDSVYEPGDPAWIQWWTVWRLADAKSHPSIEELVQRYPNLFPEGFLETMPKQ